MTKLKLNPITTKLDLVDIIEQLTDDPTTPTLEDSWVKRSGSSASIPDGTPIGLLLSLTYTDNSGTGFTYELSYRTLEGTTIRIPFVRGVNTVTEAYTLVDGDQVVLCNSTLAFTVTLPASTDGKIFNIKNINTGVITVDGNGSETIDGATTATLNQWESIRITGDGSNWYIL